MVIVNVEDVNEDVNVKGIRKKVIKEEQKYE